METAVREINTEYDAKLDAEKASISYDVLEMSGSRAVWKEVLAVYVGIVEKCENGTVYTVEGNSGDACRTRTYSVGSSVIYGYGLPAY